jgi:hypothetical protein
MADPKEWGPILWKIVHTTCEQLGKSTNLILQNDEITYFKAFQRKLLYVLPCKVCKLHYKSYMLLNIKDVPYENLKDYARNYYFDLHNKVNSSNNKELFDKTDLEKNYSISKDEYNRSIIELNKLYNKYTNLQHVSFEEVKDFNRILTMLRKFTGF